MSPIAYFQRLSHTKTSTWQSDTSEAVNASERWQNVICQHWLYSPALLPRFRLHVYRGMICTHMLINVLSRSIVSSPSCSSYIQTPDNKATSDVHFLSFQQAKVVPVVHKNWKRNNLVIKSTCLNRKSCFIWIASVPQRINRKSAVYYLFLPVELLAESMYHQIFVWNSIKVFNIPPFQNFTCQIYAHMYVYGAFHVNLTSLSETFWNNTGEMMNSFNKLFFSWKLLGRQMVIRSKFA